MKSKGVVRACAFGSVCIFVIILLLTVGLSVSAAEHLYLSQTYSLSSSDILSSSSINSSLDSSLSSGELRMFVPNKDYANLYDKSSTISNCLSDIYLDFDSIPNYNTDLFISLTQQNDELTTYVFPNGSFVNANYSTVNICIPVSTGVSSIYGSTWNLYDNVFSSGSASMSGASNQTVTIDSIEYYVITNVWSENWVYIYLCNAPIYSIDNIYETTSLSDYEQINNSDAYNSALEGSQSPDNNLVMNSGDWTFSNSSFTAPYNVSYNTGSVYPNGTISYSFLPNDYQKENSTRFTITLGFTFDYSVNYKNWGAQNGVFDSTNELTNNKKSYSANFHYSNNGVEYIDIPLSTFINNGNSASYTFEEILKHMTGDNTSYESVLLTSKELDYVEYNKFNVTCTAFISSGTESSGNVTEWYNPMNKKGYTTDSSGKINKNPYNGSNGSDVSSVGSAPGTAGNDGDNSNNIGGGSSNGSGSADAYSSVGNITINNNNTAYGGNGGNGNGGNGNGGGGSGGSETSEAAISMWNTFNPFKLIFNKLTGDVTDISDDVAETLGANGYITVLSTTFGFLPAECWTVLTWFLGATLAILIVGVILRILLDLL